MSFNPFSIATQNYLGTPFFRPAGRAPLTTEKPGCIPITIPWAVYGVSLSNPNVGVNVDMSGQTPQGGGVISTIRGVYIDNSASDGTIYIYFPDTGFSVTCQPYSVEWWPVFTGGLKATIYGKNFSTNDLSQTTVFFTNFPVTPGGANEVNYTYPQWKASPQFEAGLNLYSNGYGSPALGDQYQFFATSINNLNSTISHALFNTPFTSGGWIILTDLEIGVTNSTGVVDNAHAYSIQVQSNGLGGSFFNCSQWDNLQNSILFQKTGLQARLNAAETWSFGVTGALFGTSGTSVYCHVGYCQQTVGSTGAPASLGTIATGLASGTLTTNQSTLKYCALQFTSASNGYATSASVILTAVNFAPPQLPRLFAALYSNSGNQPAGFIGIGYLHINASIATPTQFNIHFLTQLSIVNGNKYWIVFYYDDSFDGGVTMTFQLCNAIGGFLAKDGATVTALSAIAGSKLLMAQITYTPI